MVTALDALNELREGNARYVAGDSRLDSYLSDDRRSELVSGQDPFAVVLGCADSRVPVEIVFDQGLGELFVLRVAGNIVAPSLIGSMEFAAEKFGTRLIVVLGHTQCGAVEATIEALDELETRELGNLKPIVDQIRPSVTEVLSDNPNEPAMALVDDIVRTNVRKSVEKLRNGSALIEQLVESKEMLVVGAEYSLETGVVDFFDGVSE